MIRRLGAAMLTLLFACGDGVPSGSGASQGGAGGGVADPICEVTPGHKPIGVYGGDETMLAVMDDGTLYCWRSNFTGQCDAEAYGLLHEWPLRVRNLPCVVKASAGHVGVAMTASGRAYTWGTELSNERGDGDGPSPDPTMPTLLNLVGVTDVSARSSAMGVVASGRLHWWGTTQQHASTPQPLGDANSTALTINPPVSCLRSGVGGVECWGRSAYGGLGSAAQESVVPVAVELDKPALSVASYSNTACVVENSQGVLCWGDDSLGVLGRGPASPENGFDAGPAPIDAVGPFQDVVLAGGTACAWRPTGEVLCWGRNPSGLYAPNDAVQRSVPRRVAEIEPAKQVALVNDEVCALGFDDVVRCRVGEPEAKKPQLARILDFENPPPEPE